MEVVGRVWTRDANSILEAVQHEIGVVTGLRTRRDDVTLVVCKAR